MPVLNGLDARRVVLFVHPVAQHVDVDGVKLDHAAPHAAALLVDHVRERLEHLSGVADFDAEADAHEILQGLAQMDDRDGVGLDARVGGYSTGGGLVGVAEGVELHEGVVAAVHRGLELIEDAVTGVVEDVGRRTRGLSRRVVESRGGRLVVGRLCGVVGCVVGLGVGGLRGVGGLVVGGLCGVVGLGVGGLVVGGLCSVVWSGAGRSVRIGRLGPAGRSRKSGADNENDDRAQRWVHMFSGGEGDALRHPGQSRVH